MTAPQAAAHPWLQPNGITQQKDLLPAVREGFSGRKMFRKAVGVVKAINKLSNPNLLGSRGRLNEDANDSNESLADGVFRRAPFQ